MKRNFAPRETPICTTCRTEMTLVTRSARVGGTIPGHSFYRCERCGYVTSVLLVDKDELR